jgi:hypothetical protein
MPLDPGDLTLIITPEQADLKARERFDSLRDLVQRAARESRCIDTVERGLMRQLLALGHTLLSSFVARQGDGDTELEAETAEGRTARAARPALSVDLRHQHK